MNNNTSLIFPFTSSLQKLLVSSVFILLVSQVIVSTPAEAALTALVSSPFAYNFTIAGVFKETGSLGLSTSPYWWLNSGAYVNLNEGRGSTVKGSLLSIDPFRLLYSINNPADTDGGYHPQNIFRLVTRTEWQNAQQQVYFKIAKDNLSSSPNRNSSNGLLLFNRYQSGASLYYTGVRVDGAAVIKKKLDGTYYTLTYVPGVYGGTYDHDSNPNLLPKDTWIGLRSEITNLADGKVSIKLYLDKGWREKWELVASVIDDGKTYGPAITSAGYGGIRTDFMDVTFDQFRFTDL